MVQYRFSVAVYDIAIKLWEKYYGHNYIGAWYSWEETNQITLIAARGLPYLQMRSIACFTSSTNRAFYTAVFNKACSESYSAAKLHYC